MNFKRNVKYATYAIVAFSFCVLMFSTPDENKSSNQSTNTNKCNDNERCKNNTKNQNNDISTIKNINDIKDNIEIDINNSNNTKNTNNDSSSGLTKEDATSIGLTDMEYKLINEVLDIVNEERKKNNLSPVTTNASLAKCAYIRSKELVKKFDHTRPNGTSCFTVLSENNVPMGACGENISAGYPTAKDVMNGWMNSPGHRANILNGSFKKIGIGLYKTSDAFGYHWTQIFTS